MRVPLVVLPDQASRPRSSSPQAGRACMPSATCVSTTFAVQSVADGKVSRGGAAPLRPATAPPATPSGRETTMSRHPLPLLMPAYLNICLSASSR